MDLKALGESLGLEESEFIEIVEIFLETAYMDVKKLEDAHRSQDPKAVSEAAHSLKGAAANLGFMEMASLSSKLEASAIKKDISGVPSAIPLLHGLLTQIKDTM